MRDIAQTSISISNPFAGTFAAGSILLPVVPEIELTDGFLDENGYLFTQSELFIDGELWT